MTAGLSAHVVVDREAKTVDVDVTFPRSTTTAVLGPNGAGKSTFVSALAGLVELREGQISVDGDLWEDTSTGRHVEPRRRNVGVMFQRLNLFPWLDAADNVAYPLRRKGTPRGEARSRARELLEDLGLGTAAGRRPLELSGGEAKRVALARAIVTRPSVLLLDEPLSELDATTRTEVRHLLGEYLRAFEGVAIVVSHDYLDAAALADSVVVLEEGRVSQSGTFDDLAARPQTRYVADLRGTNLYRGNGEGTSVRVGNTTVVVADEAPSTALVAIDPRAVALHLDEPKGSARNAWLLSVSAIEPSGCAARIILRGDIDIVAEVTPGSVVDLALEPGRAVWASVKATEISVYPA
ncbi:MAG: ABC transporter ATP-binding protein [Actinomycetota bacterium]|nr:ABC transporter ATP-binding protein [Actinomycetota bacterium]